MWSFVVDKAAKSTDLLDAVALLLIDLLEKEEAQQPSPGPSPRAGPDGNAPDAGLSGGPAP
jgi:hypothetical protein